MMDLRSKYRNPSSTESEEPGPELKNHLTRVKYNFYDLILESGILYNPDTDSDNQSEDEEIVVLPPEPKEPPPLIDLEDDYASLSIKEESTVSNKQVDEAEKKIVKIKKGRSKEDSDSSSSSSHEDRRRKKYKTPHDSKDKRRSRSHSPKDRKRRIKTESEDEETKYYSLRSYFCKVCNLTLNSEDTYISHIQGKRHKKALKQSDPLKAIEDCLKSSLVSQQSHNSSGRIKLNEVALIQPAVEKLDKPCPGLHLVVEIRGLKETSFYCKLCNSPCSNNSLIPHLRGYKHLLNLLKHYDLKLYERYSPKSKREVERKIIDRLKEIERKHGKGKVTVEMETESKQNLSGLQRGHLFPNPEPLPGPSHASDFDETDVQHSVPDFSKGTFHCRICDADMNNKDMWSAHIIGKRHLKNLKKNPNETPSKLKRVRAPNLRPILLDLIQDVEDPIVGLEYMRETQNPETGGAQYNCNICGACLTHCDVVDHLLTQKHMTKFLEAKKHSSILLLKDLQMNQNAQLSIILENCAVYERQHGRGEIEVYITKK